MFFTPRVYICTGVYIVHMNEALEKGNIQDPK